MAAFVTKLTVCLPRAAPGKHQKTKPKPAFVSLGGVLLRIKLLTVTSLAAIVPGVSPFIEKVSAIQPATTPDLSSQLADIQSVAVEAAREHQVDPNMVLSVMATESAFQADAVSPKGARGPMQVMPETARELGYDPSNVQQSIEAGTVYLGMMISRYRNRKNGVELALAAYNAGPTAVAKYGGIPPYRETRNYVKRVLAHYRSGQFAARATIPTPAFAD
jgi:soluble lytic murein transglycosylase-like protein